jgi:site-specific recombinase
MSLLGIAMVGATNLAVSFSLALAVALHRDASVSAKAMH